MIRRFFIILYCLLLASGVSKSFAEIDKDEQGPASFFYEEYYQQPWRNPMSYQEIIRKSSGLLIVSAIAFGFLYAKKKKA